MTLASLSFRNALHHDLDVITTAAPRCFPALATRSSAAHKLTFPSLFLLDFLWASNLLRLAMAAILLWNSG
jgi:hypothetical protein